MQNVVVGKLTKYQFDSLSELARWIIDTPRTWGSVNQSESMNRRETWDLGAGYDDAVKMARDGWLHGAREAERYLVTLPPKDAAPDTVTDFYGHLPHVARYCAGAPDSMIRHTQRGTAGSGKVLTLYVPINALANTNAKNMSNFGLGLAQYVNQLEQQGTRIDLFGMFVSAMSDGTKLSHAWRIKSADQFLDLAVLAFSVGHPAMFRRLGFALYERSNSKACSSYGRTEASKLSDLIDPPAGAYIVNGMKDANTIARTPEKALQHIQDQIEKMLDTPDAD